MQKRKEWRENDKPMVVTRLGCKSGIWGLVSDDVGLR